MSFLNRHCLTVLTRFWPRQCNPKKGGRNYWLAHDQQCLSESVQFCVFGLVYYKYFSELKGVL